MKVVKSAKFERLATEGTAIINLLGSQKEREGKSVLKRGPFVCALERRLQDIRQQLGAPVRRG